MNYTTNYHLPQWDEDDRIMRVDFNDAMANLEEGLTCGRDGGEENRTQNWNRLIRLSYNHYCMVRSMEPLPNQIGMFYQDVAKDPSGVAGTMVWDGARFAGKNEAALDAVAVENAYQQLTPLIVSPNNPQASKPLTAIFTPPASGRINLYFIHGTYTNNNPDLPLECRLTLTNLDNGIVEKPVDLTLNNTGVNGGFNYNIDAPIYFLGGVRYQVTIQPLTYPCAMEATFQPGGRSVIPYANEGNVSAVMKLHEPEGGRGGMVVLHCIIGGKGGRMTMKWDDKELEPQISRIAQAGGRSVQELIFLREDAISADSQLSLNFACENGGSFLFYDWGAMLF